MKPAILTRHALLRLDELLTLSESEVKNILDFGKTLMVGRDRRQARRAHILFFSPPDNQCFVAVQDTDTGEVVTILPPDFDRHCVVSSEAINALSLPGIELPPLD